MPDFYDPKDIATDEYVLVACEQNQNDPCWFRLPRVNRAVWLAKVVQIIRKPNTRKEYQLLGWWFYNEQRDLTKPLEMRDDPEWIDLKANDIVGVYDPQDDFKLTKANIKEVVDFITQQEDSSDD